MGLGLQNEARHNFDSPILTILFIPVLFSSSSCPAAPGSGKMAHMSRFRSVRPYVILVLLLAVGFASISVVGFFSSQRSIRDGILLKELPLTADTVYSEIQKDLIRPVFVSSMMATDTFLRHWVLQGETDTPRMVQYLADIQKRFGAVTAFFVSAQTGRYYHPGGILKTVSRDEPRDAWFWRVAAMTDPYETNVDLDMAHSDQLTIFINYRVFDFGGHFIGAAGVGLTVATVKDFVRSYEERYDRRVLFTDGQGRVTLSADAARPVGTDLQSVLPWDRVKTVTDGSVVSLDYREKGVRYLASARYLPELKWFLIVEKDEGPAMAGIQSILWMNLGLCVLVSAVVVVVFWLTAGGYQRRLELLAWTDPLTGLENRQALEANLKTVIAQARRTGESLVLGMIDADHFKDINDGFGHGAGDQTLKDLAGLLRSGIREDDRAARWGGEEFVVVLRRCGRDDGLARFQSLLKHVDGGSWTRPETAVTVSIGVAGFDGESVEVWIARADAALYRAKHSGRHRVEVAD
jgi:diguanylate cyclase (GGDEF)-like protein